MLFKFINQVALLCSKNARILCNYFQKRFVEYAVYLWHNSLLSFQNKSVTTMSRLYRYCSYVYKYTSKMVVVLISHNCKEDLRHYTGKYL